MPSFSNKMPSQPDRGPDYGIRMITIITLVPAFALLLPHGIVTGLVFPALGLIPMAISAASGLVHILGWPVSLKNGGFVDLAIAAFLLGMLVPSWVLLARYTWRSMTMLGSYGTAMLMVNLTIHSYFVLRDLPRWRLWHILDDQATCPLCHCGLARCAPANPMQGLQTVSRPWISGRDSYAPVAQQAPEQDMLCRPSFETTSYLDTASVNSDATLSGHDADEAANEKKVSLV